MKYKLNLLHKKEKKHGTTLTNEEILKKKKKKPWRIELKKWLNIKSTFGCQEIKNHFTQAHITISTKWGVSHKKLLQEFCISSQSKAWNELPTDHTTHSWLCVCIFTNSFVFIHFTVSLAHWNVQTWPSELPACTWHDSRQRVPFSSALVRNKRERVNEFNDPQLP